MRRPTGTVTTAGRTLVVRPPVGVADAVWADVRHVLRPLRGHVLEGGGGISVAVERASQLRDALSRYPASRIEWRWEADADRASCETVAVADTLNTVVTLEVEEQAVWPERLDLPAAGFARELRPFQRRSAARLLRMGNGADFSVPGSGKTTVAYAVYAALRRLGVVDVMVVVAPPSAFEAWETEERECFAVGQRPVLRVRPGFASRDVDVLVLNYERLELRRTLAEIDTWAGNRRVLAVFDEAHRAKAGLAGVRGRAARVLAERSRRRLVLTGTPMPNGPDDLAAVFDLVWPGQGHRLATGDLGAVRDRAFVRVTKEDLDLPELMTRVEVVELDGAHRRLYDALAGRAASTISDESADVAEIGRAVMRLIAAATNPAAVLDPFGEFALPANGSDAALMTMLVDPTTHIRPAKIIRAAQLVAANATRGRKTLVWSNFVGNVAALRDALAEHSPAVITGATPVSDTRSATDRTRELARFRSEPRCRVLIATPQTLGEGVSLHRVCFDQIHVDRGFAAGTFIQSLDRTHRLGMDPESSPTCTILTAADTIDQAVHDVLSRKVRAMASALDDSTLRPVSDPLLAGSVTLEDLLLGDANRAELVDLLRHVLR
jgi:superfamily II DNA or RNA helicase